MSVSYFSSEGSFDLKELELKSKSEWESLKPTAALTSEEEGLVLEAVTPIISADDLTQPFKPIGIGKPLSVRIHTIYPGKVSSNSRRRKDVLVVSGLKSEQTFNKTSRMINMLDKDVANHQYLQFSAFENGSRIVSYTPALTDSGLFCSFELITDNFDSSLVDKIGNLFKMAGGLPIFAPASAYLMAGSFLTKMFSSLGKAFVETGPILKETIQLNFGVGGTLNFKEGLYIVHSQANATQFAGLNPALRNSGELVLADEEGNAYTGDAPYLVIGVNGKSELMLENFSSQAASAALLEDFYPTENSGGVLVDELGNALGVYNDLKFRRKAEKMKKHVDDLVAAGKAEDDPELVSLKKLLDAYKKNISSEELQLE